ncbi:hypothetical protein OVA19_00165 [Streptomyces sp. SL203]|nr:hypothetical protein [Streptomyces sp. SL203]MCY1649236.1 hypothetical protein [Streptomyces sp. SL203]
MSNTLPQIAPETRLPISPNTRMDVSTVIGLDLDLILGFEYEIPADLTEAEQTEALLAAFGEEYARVAALVDMIDTGFVDVPRSYGRLLVLADELERADTADGYEYDELDESLGRWAA